MIKERTKQVEQKEKYIICDRCKKEITNRPDLIQKVTFYGIGLSYTEYVQGEWTYDCCNKCMQEVAKEFKDKDSKNG
jgi:hypothetical protein